MTRKRTAFADIVLAEVGECMSFCSHGGRCFLNKGHIGMHDSGYCNWDTKDELSKKEADAILMKKLKKDGVLYSPEDING